MIPENERAGFFSDDCIRKKPHQIYAKPCPKCPSMYGDDPESADIRTWDRDLQLGLLFVCAWRQRKLCKGLCDKGGFTEEEVLDFKSRYLNP